MSSGTSLKGQGMKWVLAPGDEKGMGGGDKRVSAVTSVAPLGSLVPDCQGAQDQKQERAGMGYSRPHLSLFLGPY